MVHYLEFRSSVCNRNVDWDQSQVGDWEITPLNFILASVKAVFAKTSYFWVPDLEAFPDFLSGSPVQFFSS
jgi:hypothetical protein